MADMVQDYTKKSYVPICLDAPVHTQHKEGMLCQTKGVFICPIHLDTPICLDAPCMLGLPLVCLGAPLYV